MQEAQQPTTLESRSEEEKSKIGLNTQTLIEYINQALREESSANLSLLSDELLQHIATNNITMPVDSAAFLSWAESLDEQKIEIINNQNLPVLHILALLGLEGAVSIAIQKGVREDIKADIAGEQVTAQDCVDVVNKHARPNQVTEPDELLPATQANGLSIQNIQPETDPQAAAMPPAPPPKDSEKQTEQGDSNTSRIMQELIQAIQTIFPKKKLGNTSSTIDALMTYVTERSALPPINEDKISSIIDSLDKAEVSTINEQRLPVLHILALLGLQGAVDAATQKGVREDITAKIDDVATTAQECLDYVKELITAKQEAESLANKQPAEVPMQSIEPRESSLQAAAMPPAPPPTGTAPSIAEAKHTQTKTSSEYIYGSTRPVNLGGLPLEPSEEKDRQQKHAQMNSTTGIDVSVQEIKSANTQRLIGYIDQALKEKSPENLWSLPDELLQHVATNESTMSVDGAAFLSRIKSLGSEEVLTINEQQLPILHVLALLNLDAAIREAVIGKGVDPNIVASIDGEELTALDCAEFVSKQTKQDAGYDELFLGTKALAINPANIDDKRAKTILVSCIVKGRDDLVDILMKEGMRLEEVYKDGAIIAKGFEEQKVSEDMVTRLSNLVQQRQEHLNNYDALLGTPEYLAYAENAINSLVGQETIPIDTPPYIVFLSLEHPDGADLLMEEVIRNGDQIFKIRDNNGYDIFGLARLHDNQPASNYLHQLYCCHLIDQEIATNDELTKTAKNLLKEDGVEGRYKEFTQLKNILLTAENSPVDEQLSISETDIATNLLRQLQVRDLLIDVYSKDVVKDLRNQHELQNPEETLESIIVDKTIQPAEAIKIYQSTQNIIKTFDKDCAYRTYSIDEFNQLMGAETKAISAKKSTAKDWLLLGNKAIFNNLELEEDDKAKMLASGLLVFVKRLSPIEEGKLLESLPNPEQKTLNKALASAINENLSMRQSALEALFGKNLSDDEKRALESTANKDSASWDGILEKRNTVLRQQEKLELLSLYIPNDLISMWENKIYSKILHKAFPQITDEQVSGLIDPAQDKTKLYTEITAGKDTLLKDGELEYLGSSMVSANVTNGLQEQLYNNVLKSVFPVESKTIDENLQPSLWGKMDRVFTTDEITNLEACHVTKKEIQQWQAPLYTKVLRPLFPVITDEQVADLINSETQNRQGIYTAIADQRDTVLKDKDIATLVQKNVPGELINGLQEQLYEKVLKAVFKEESKDVSIPLRDNLWHKMQRVLTAKEMQDLPTLNLKKEEIQEWQKLLYKNTLSRIFGSITDAQIEALMNPEAQNKQETYAAMGGARGNKALNEGEVSDLKRKNIPQDLIEGVQNSIYKNILGEVVKSISPSVLSRSITDEAVTDLQHPAQDNQSIWDAQLANIHRSLSAKDIETLLAKNVPGKMIDRLKEQCDGKILRNISARTQGVQLLNSVEEQEALLRNVSQENIDKWQETQLQKILGPLLKIDGKSDKTALVAFLRGSIWDDEKLNWDNLLSHREKPLSNGDILDLQKKNVPPDVIDRLDNRLNDKVLRKFLLDDEPNDKVSREFKKNKDKVRGLYNIYNKYKKECMEQKEVAIPFCEYLWNNIPQLLTATLHEQLKNLGIRDELIEKWQQKTYQTMLKPILNKSEDFTLKEIRALMNPARYPISSNKELWDGILGGRTDKEFNAEELSALEAMGMPKDNIKALKFNTLPFASRVIKKMRKHFKHISSRMQKSITSTFDAKDVNYDNINLSLLGNKTKPKAPADHSDDGSIKKGFWGTLLRGNRLKSSRIKPQTNESSTPEHR